MIDPMNDAEVERMARAIYEELVANRHWDDVPLGDRDDFVHLLRRAMLSARPALSDGPTEGKRITGDIDRDTAPGGALYTSPEAAELGRQFMERGVAMVRAMRPTLSTESGWRDISTAPRDEWVLVWTRFPDPEDGPIIRAMEVGHGSDYGAYWKNSAGGEINADFWMPLPTPPTETER